MAALSFGKVKGESSKDKVPSYKMKDGNNKVRIVGGVLARYIYWVPNKGGTNSPVECLAFDRNEEKFTNVEKDWVKEYFPDLKAEWAYASLVIDTATDEPSIVIFNHKKKLLKSIIDVVEDLGDPSDIEKGWDVAFSRAKTGPKVYNVEYTLQPLKCKERALTEAERALVEAHPTIDEVLKRPDPESIKKYLDEIRAGGPSTGEAVDDEIPEDFT
jgi:hypothetical protein